MAEAAEKMPDRWYALKYHKMQQAYMRSKARFNVVPSGRRSGKTEIAKRRAVRKALKLSLKLTDARIGFCAPTRPQAKLIYWEDLKLMVPNWMRARKPLETELRIDLITGGQLHVLGMDRPERVEGTPWDHLVLDEFGNMKKSAWESNCRPALSTIGRLGTADFIGVPEGRNHYYGVAQKAKSHPDWAYWHWFSSAILPKSEIDAAREEMDEKTFRQEYEGSFESYEGRIYYSYDRQWQSVETLAYDPNVPLIFCFDFNVEPGVAVVCQEQRYKGNNPLVTPSFTAAIGEVWIPKNSNTPAVCRKLAQDWQHHTGDVYCYGDSTGGARGTAKLDGTDWELIKANLRNTFRNCWQKVPKANPRERVRVNALNSRLKSESGQIKMLIDPFKCPRLIHDLEGVVALEGGSGEINKKHDDELTHISDAVGYYIA